MRFAFYRLLCLAILSATLFGTSSRAQLPFEHCFENQGKTADAREQKILAGDCSLIDLHVAKMRWSAQCLNGVYKTSKFGGNIDAERAKLEAACKAASKGKPTVPTPTVNTQSPTVAAPSPGQTTTPNIGTPPNVTTTTPAGPTPTVTTPSPTVPNPSTKNRGWFSWWPF